jgi:serine/threonine protein kinase
MDVSRLRSFPSHLENFRVTDELIGEGIGGTVKIACQRDDCQYAVKILEYDSDPRPPEECLSGEERVRQELTISMMMSDLGIGPHVYETIMEPPQNGTGCAYLVMDKYDGTLSDFQDSPDRDGLYDVVRGLIRKMYEAGIIHRDLRPDNILYRRLSGTNKIQLVISDFGLAIFSDDPVLQELDFNRLYDPWYIMPVKLTRDGQPCEFWV